MPRNITKDRVRSAEDALAYLTDCTLATVEGHPKSASKYERKRQIAMAQTSIDWMREMKIEPSGRAVDVIERFEGNVEKWANAPLEERYPTLKNLRKVGE